MPNLRSSNKRYLYEESDEATKIFLSFTPSSFLRISELPRYFKTGEIHETLKRKQDSNKLLSRANMRRVPKQSAANHGMRLFNKFEYVSSPYQPPLVLVCDKNYEFHSNLDNKIAQNIERSMLTKNKSITDGMIDFCSGPRCDKATTSKLPYLYGPFRSGNEKLQNIRADSYKQLTCIAQHLFELLKKRYNKSNFHVQISENQRMVQATFETKSLIDNHRTNLGKVMNDLLQSDKFLSEKSFYKAPKEWGIDVSKGSCEMVRYSFCQLTEARRQGIEVLMKSNEGHYKKKEVLDIDQIIQKSKGWKSY